MEEAGYSRRERDGGKQYTKETGRGRFIVALKRCRNKTGEVGIYLRLFKSSPGPRTNPAPLRIS